MSELKRIKKNDGKLLLVDFDYKDITVGGFRSVHLFITRKKDK